MSQLHNQTEQYFFNSILRFPNHALIGTDEKGLITLWNIGAERLWGYKREEVIGRSVSTLVADSNGPEITKTLLALLSMGELIPLREIECRHKNGKRIQVLLNLGPITDDEGRFIGSSNIAYSFEEQSKLRSRLQKREEDYRTIFELNPSPLLIIDLQTGKFVKTNKATTDQFGYSSNEFYNMSFQDLMPIKETISSQEHYDDLDSISASTEAIHMLRRKNGDTIWAKIKTSSIRHDNENCVLLLVNDISDSKRAEQALAKREQSFRENLDMMLEGIEIIDKEWRYAYINKAAITYNRYSREELIGYTVMEKYPGIEDSNIFRAMKKAMDDREYQYIETEFTFPDGSEAWFEISIQPVPEGILVLSMDVSNRKNTEANFQDAWLQLKNYKNALDRSAIVAITDLSGNIQYSNDNFTQISGYTPDELIGQNHRIVNSGLHPPEFFKDLWKTIIAGKIWHGEIRNRKKDGTYYWVDTTIIPLIDGNNRPTQFLSIRYDITEKQNIKQSLLNVNNELRNLTNHLESIREEERKNIAREIHDDLGQQLTGLKIDIHWLMTRSEHGCTEIHEKTEHMLELVNSSIKTMRRVIETLRPAILDDLGLTDALEWQAKDFEQRTGIRCILNLLIDEENIPKEFNTTLFRIFQEALTNIMRYSKASRVTAEMFEGEHELIFEIIDDGIGIRESDKNKNTSFGLLGMRERANFHGGTLNIIGTPEEGTKIILKLPLIKHENTDC